MSVLSSARRPLSMLLLVPALVAGTVVLATTPVRAAPATPDRPKTTTTTTTTTTTMRWPASGGVPGKTARDPGGKQPGVKQPGGKQPGGRHPGGADRTGPTLGGDTGQRRETGAHIVELADPPVATYAGGRSGLPQTRARAGERLDAGSTAARAYAAHLASQRADVLATAKVGTPRQVYTVAFNGFTAKLSDPQVAALTRDPRVRAVTKAHLVSASTVRTPNLLGLDATGGLWQQLGGSGPTGAGRDVVIGVIDSGIWPESASFAGRLAAPPGWRGTCQPGEQWTVNLCNGKIVGARYFADGLVAATGGIPAGEVRSARDMRGHGTHVAATAAGNDGPRAVVDGRDLGRVSGMAPAARIAVYKALWGAGGTEEDILAAIDAAVADGVHVLNYSIGDGGQIQPNTPIGNAFLGATLAGVFVAAAAGNNGADGTLDNLYPWVTTVAAGVHTGYEGTVRLGDGTELVGVTMDQPLPAATPLVAGADAGNADCLTGTLAAAKVANKVVVCGASRADVAVAELRAKRAAGVVFHQPGGGLRVNRIHNFPAVYLPAGWQSNRILHYLRKNPGTATVTLRSGGDGSSAPGYPSVADFSSKGPDQLHLGLLKPDLTAPGVDVVAAVSPPGNGGRAFDAYSGTSMASPHVAGLAALLRQAHPDWSPAAISSALRTTSGATAGTTTAYEQGSGWVRPQRATDPGLVFEPTAAEYTAFRDAAEPDGRDINLPAISLRQFDASQPVTVQRRVRNVSSRTETYRASVTGLNGLSVQITPNQFTVAPGQTVPIQVRVGRGSAPWDRFQFGQLTLTGSSHTVSIPVAARPWGVMPWYSRESQDDPLRLQSGGSPYCWVGFSGTLGVRTTGWTAMAANPGTVPDGGVGEPFDPAGPGVKAHRFTVPASTGALAFGLFSNEGGNELDLYLYKDGRGVAYSNYWGNYEEIELPLPEPGEYTLYVHAYQTANGQRADYDLSHLILDRSANYGNATATVPNPVTRGQRLDVAVTETGPVPPYRKYAYLEFSRGTEVIPGMMLKG
ncbi:MAG TPA: S8 family serine peptidase [Catenuloplanes sp.]